MKPTINWVGSLWINHSFGLVNREILSRLVKISDSNFSIKPYEEDPKFIISPNHKNLLELLDSNDKESDVTIRHQWPPNFNKPISKKWVLMQPWEFGSIPDEWYIPMKYLIDEVWVFSEYNKTCYVRSGIPESKIKVIPHGVDSETFNYNVTPLPIETNKNFKFLFVGGTIYRKGIDILLESYLETFTSADDVCLVIKENGKNGSYRGQTFESFIEKAKEDPNNPEIVYMDDELTSDEMAALYKACDCLVHPYRGEGFGLPIVESMACGTPAVVPSLGPSQDFCNESNAFSVSSKEFYLESKNIGHLKTVDYPWLIEIDKDELKKKLKWISINNDVVSQKGKMASEFILSKFTWNHSVALYNELIDCLAKRKSSHVNENEIILSETKIGIDLYNSGEYEAALKIFEILNEIKPNDVDTRINRGILLVQLKKFEQALEQFLLIDRKNLPTEIQVELMNLIGISYINCKEEEKALEFFWNSLELDSNNEIARENYNKLLGIL